MLFFDIGFVPETMIPVPPTKFTPSTPFAVNVGCVCDEEASMYQYLNVLFMDTTAEPEGKPG